jgi:NAD(P)H dehydrogenase (quinone)
MITVTGATGHLGRLAVGALLARGVAAGDVTAAVRHPERARDLGVRAVHADYGDPASLAAAFAGTERLLFVSSNSLGSREVEHGNVVRAAADAGVGLVAYTSILHADTSGMLLAADHQFTERAIRAAGLPFVFLRNGWYLENYTGQLDGYLGAGVISGAAGEGRVSAAARADFAEAAAVVLSEDGHQGAVYELAGDASFTMPELAAELGRRAGKPVRYENLAVADYAARLAGFGLPEAVARVYADADGAVARGQLADDGGQLGKLIGRPTTPLADAIAAALS